MTKNNLILTIIISTITLTASATPKTFTWSDYKATIEEGSSNSGTSKVIDIDEYVTNKYGPSAQKESIAEKREKRDQRGLSVHLQYNLAPDYTEEITNPQYAIDSLTCVQDPTSIKCDTPATIIESGNISGVSIVLEGPMDFTPIGITTSGISSKIALSDQSIDMIVYKRIIGSGKSAFTADVGGGFKTAISDGKVFKKGFHGLGSVKASIYLDNYVAQAGADILLQPPVQYTNGSDRINPFFSMGMGF